MSERDWAWRKIRAREVETISMADAPLTAEPCPPAPAGLTCPGCRGRAGIVTRWSRSRNGVMQLRADCTRCRRFIKWVGKADARRAAAEEKRRKFPGPLATRAGVDYPHDGRRSDDRGKDPRLAELLGHLERLLKSEDDDALLQAICAAVWWLTRSEAERVARGFFKLLGGRTLTPLRPRNEQSPEDGQPSDEEGNGDE
jgi:hypothetical protein